MHCDKHWDMSCDKRQYIESTANKNSNVHVFLTSELFTTNQGKATDKNQDQTEAKQLQ